MQYTLHLSMPSQSTGALWPRQAPGSLSRRGLPSFLVAVALVVLGAGCAHVPERTALDRYVEAADPHYGYRLVHAISGQDHDAYVLEMTSQSWRTPEEVTPNVWKHWLTVVRPKEVRNTTSLLFITGGSNENPPPPRAEKRLVEIAIRTRSVVSELRMVPNQPLQFAGESEPRSEDALIAYSWDKYLRTGDPLWPAQLAMTKSAVRALDTISSFCGSTAGGSIPVDSFVVAGGSKRGWTTWTTAIVDRRVVAIVPLVIDMLNVEPSFQHHFRAYGFYAPAVQDYVEMGIMEWQGTPPFRSLMKMVEPYEYRQRLTLPKLLVNSTGDQFFLPDSAQFYFRDLKGPAYLRYVPNTDHSLKDSDAIETLAAFYDAVLRGVRLPRFSWELMKDGSMRVQTEDSPAEVKLWQATNPATRDFRLETIGPAWTSTPLDAAGKGVYLGQVKTPERGWTAYMIELTFSNPEGLAPFKFTTQVQVLPAALPYEFKRSKEKG